MKISHWWFYLQNFKKKNEKRERFSTPMAIAGKYRKFLWKYNDLKTFNSVKLLLLIRFNFNRAKIDWWRFIFLKTDFLPKYVKHLIKMRTFQQNSILTFTKEKTQKSLKQNFSWLNQIFIFRTSRKAITYIKSLKTWTVNKIRKHVY